MKTDPQNNFAKAEPVDYRLSLVLLAVGLLFIGIGVYFGELGRIFEKATQVCLQCIGIG